jgi:hypothetical protein
VLSNNNDIKMDVLDVDTDDYENLQCEDCMFAPDLIPFHNGNKYLCSECGRIYDTESGDIAKHPLRLRSEVDDVMISESSEPMVVNFGDQYYAAKTNNNNDTSNQFFLDDKILRKPGITILEEYTTHYDNVE